MHSFSCVKRDYTHRMSAITDVPPWLSGVRAASCPLYAAIADAIAAAIANGELPEGARLPPLRTLAGSLGVDYTTVSRAYAEAGRRGLVEGHVGQGTFVRRGRVGRAAPPADGLIDLSMNTPPSFQDADLRARMWHGIAGLERAGGLELLLLYQRPGGAEADRAAGLAWLSRRLPSAARERVLVCPGAQGAMLAVLSTLTAPGDTVLAEALTYPGFRSLCAQLRLRVHGVAIDQEGLDPDALDAACRQHMPKALYCTPTLHNPTTATMSSLRREAVVGIARRHGVPIIEDDAYGELPAAAPPPLAALAPELTWHVRGLAKCLAPALRIAYLLTPDARGAARAAGAIRAAATMVSPLTAAIATRWIEDGTADAVLAAIRAETRKRQAIAAELLPADQVATSPDGFHVWLSLPQPWTRGELAARLRSAGLGVVTSDAFALEAAPEAVRIGLGGAVTHAALAEGMRLLADLLDQPPALSSMIV
jgi:DNA-binding transcriptional MocR family regulator